MLRSILQTKHVSNALHRKGDPVPLGKGTTFHSPSTPEREPTDVIRETSKGAHEASRSAASIVALNRENYACTHHGCALSFDTPAKLQRHEHEGHRNSAWVTREVGEGGMNPDFSSSSDNDEQPLTYTCSTCDILESGVARRHRRIASLQRQLKDFGAAVRLLGTEGHTNPPTSPQSEEAHKQKFIRSALLVLEHRRTGEFEDVRDVAARILDAEHSARTRDDEEMNIMSALSTMGHRLTGKSEDALDLARRIIERGDWDLNMSALPPERPERRSLADAATHGPLPSVDSGYGTSCLLVQDCANCHTRVTPEWRRGFSEQRDLCNSCGLRWAKQTSRTTSDTNTDRVSGISHTSAPIITNTETQGAWLGLETNAEDGDQPVPGDIRAVAEAPNHNEVFSSGYSTKMPQEVANWYALNEGPWSQKLGGNTAFSAGSVQLVTRPSRYPTS